MSAQPRSFNEGWLAADGMPAKVCAGTVMRHAPGCSRPPFDRCNLGLRCGDDPEAVSANRAGLVDWLGLPAAPIWLRQVHGTEVANAEALQRGEEPVADAAVCSRVGMVLVVQTADCLPVVLASADGNHIGIAHAGWRGLLDGVVERTVAAMAVPPSLIRAWLGPAIGAESFEVGPEVRSAFTAAQTQATEAFRPGSGDRWWADLYALARQRLLGAGVTDIHGGDLDTYADRDRFHSYRRDGVRSGRMATLVWRR